MRDPDNSISDSISGLNSPRASQTNITTNPLGVSSDVAEDIRNEFRNGEGEEPILKKVAIINFLLTSVRVFR
jgi:hypothetical protein